MALKKTMPAGGRFDLTGSPADYLRLSKITAAFDEDDRVAVSFDVYQSQAARDAGAQSIDTYTIVLHRDKPYITMDGPPDENGDPTQVEHDIPGRMLAWLNAVRGLIYTAAKDDPRLSGATDA